MLEKEARKKVCPFGLASRLVGAQDLVYYPRCQGNECMMWVVASMEVIGGIPQRIDAKDAETGHCGFKMHI